MSKERYKDTRLGSFFGNFLYDDKVPRDHPDLGRDSMR